MIEEPYARGMRKKDIRILKTKKYSQRSLFLLSGIITNLNSFWNL